MEGENTKLLLITANVGSIFEDPECMLKIWMKEFLMTIHAMEPGMVAIHCQEVGGKNYEASMQHVNHFVKAMLGSEELQKYDRARVFLDEDYTAVDKFTALGNLYFIHECVEDVMIFDFIECKFLPVEGREVLSGNIENIQIKEKSKYPQNFFPDFKWSRKGFLRTRWSINNCVFDLINIHLFHDASNLVAMQKSPSIYVENRYRALAHTLQRFETDQFDSVPYFLFGDFNFRLDVKLLLKELMEKTEEHQTRGKKDQISKITYTDANNKVVLSLESKNFDHFEKHNEVFSNKDKLLNKYDTELQQYKDTLYEYDVDFPPSYPFSEDVGDGLSYMKTRCPSWCDRILLSHSTRDIIHSDEKSKPKYHIIGKDVCMGDHKPVYLSLLLKKGKGKRHPSLGSQTSIERRRMLSKKISINGETVDISEEDVNIHDYAEFEKHEQLIPEFRFSIKKRALSEKAPEEKTDGEGGIRKAHSFQNIARQVRLMESALMKWQRRPRSRHHSSSSEDGAASDDEKDKVETASVHTDVMELSDTEDVKLEEKSDKKESTTAERTENASTHRQNGENGQAKSELEDKRKDGTSEKENLLLHENDRSEHVHDQGVKNEVGVAKSSSGAEPEAIGWRRRCPCVVL